MDLARKTAWLHFSLVLAVAHHENAVRSVYQRPHALNPDSPRPVPDGARFLCQFRPVKPAVCRNAEFRVKQEVDRKSP
jgi:hypothetical protein